MKRIFYLDDDELAGFTITKMLEKLGFQVKNFSRFEDLEEKLKEEKPDYILLDLIMPEKNGREVYEYIKENYSELSKRTFFITGSPNSLIPKEVPYLEKPITLDKLRSFFDRIGK